MLYKRSILPLAVLLTTPAIALAGSMTLLGVGSAPLLNYKNWHDAAAGLPCDRVKQVGSNVQVLGAIVVNGETVTDSTITNPGEINIIDKRCFK